MIPKKHGGLHWKYFLSFLRKRYEKAMETNNNVNAKNYDKTLVGGRRKGRCVCDPRLARNLLRMGHEIIDIKPNRLNRIETVFVFKITDTLDSDLNMLAAKFGESLENYGGIRYIAFNKAPHYRLSDLVYRDSDEDFSCEIRSEHGENSV